MTLSISISCKGSGTLTPVPLPPSRVHQLMRIFDPGPDRPVDSRRYVILHLFQSLPSSSMSRRYDINLEFRPPYRHKELMCLVYDRHVHSSMPPQRRLLRSSRPSGGPITRTFTQTADPLPSVPTTPIANREVPTEPSTPTSPTLDTHSYRRTISDRRHSAAFVQAVLHYDRSENDLQPWFW